MNGRAISANWKISLNTLFFCSAGIGQVDDSVLSGLLNISWPQEALPDEGAGFALRSRRL